MLGALRRPKLDVDRRGDTDELGNFVVADETAKIVRGFHINIQRQAHHLADGGNLRQGQIGGRVIGGRAQLFDQADRDGVGRAHLHRDLDDQVRGQLAIALELVDQPEQALIRHQDRADAQLAGAADILGRVDQAGPCRAGARPGSCPPGKGSARPCPRRRAGRQTG